MRYEDIKSVDLLDDTPRYEATKGNLSAIYSIGVFTEESGLILADAVYSFTVEELEEDDSGHHTDISSVVFTVDNPLLCSIDDHEGVYNLTGVTYAVDDYEDLYNLTELVEEFINSNGIETTRGETDKDFLRPCYLGRWNI